MHKPAFLTNERLSRLLVSVLLCLGVILPLLMSFGIGETVMPALLVSAGILALLTIIDTQKKGKLLLLILCAAFCVLQLVLPNLGFFGNCYDAIKAITLYFRGITSAAPLFAMQIAMLLAVASAILSYAFSSKAVGFLPATILVVLVLFGLWGLGMAAYLWYTLPALVALLLLISQTSHEKINLLEVLPIAAIVVVLSMLIVPSGQTTIPPLYSAAMTMKQTISDYLFFTEPRNVFTLGSYGYYPMGNGKLGGEVAPSEFPVMTVKSDKRVLLRAVVKDEYSGRNWRDTSSGKRYLYVNPRWAALRSNVFLENLPSSAVRAASELLQPTTIAVQMQNTATSTVFTPTFLRDFRAESNMVGYFNDASELFITRDLQRDDRYTVHAPILEGGNSGLGSIIDAVPKGVDKNYPTMLADFTQLPSHLEQKVYNDANNIVSGANTPYDKASAIMRHLQRYYKYTLKPATPPENQDFVTYFLYVDKQGYCTYFASAMTVLCRMAGLPARYVEGFLISPGEDGLSYITGAEAHAWTEVYFEDFGWVPFDPTPAQQNVNNQPPENDQPQPSPSPSPEPDDLPEPSPEPPDNPNPSEEPDQQEEDPPEIPPDDQPPFPWWWLLIAAAAVGGLVLRITIRMPDRIAEKQTTAQDKIFIYGNATYALMMLLKRTPRAGETPLLFARRMDKQNAFPAPILPLWRLMALSNYSRMKPGVEQTARAKETFLRMYKSQRFTIKLAFMFKAAFSNKCYVGLETKVTHVEPGQMFSYKGKLVAKKGIKHTNSEKEQKPTVQLSPKHSKKTKQ